MSARNRLILTPQADLDLDDIYLYSIDTFGDVVADSYMAHLNDGFLNLTAFPDMGMARNDLGVGIRALIIGQHCIYYASHEDQILVRRVMHIRQHVGQADVS